MDFMNKNIFKLIILIFSLMITVCLPVAATPYMVVKVSDGDTVYLDFNSNGIPDKNERVRLNGIDAFEVHNGSHIEKQMQKFNLSLEDCLKLGYLGKKFAEKELLYKVVDANFTAEVAFDAYDRPIMSISYDNGKSYEEEILKAGLATVYSYSNLAKKLKKYENKKLIKKNIELSKNLSLVFYNFNSKESYPLNSEEGFEASNILIEAEDVK